MRARAACTWLVLASLAVGAIPAGAQSLYWIDTNFPGPNLGRSDADGSNVQFTPLPSGSLPEGLAIDPGNGHAYFVEAAYSSARVRRASIATLGFHADLVTGGSAFRGVDLDLTNSKIYWTSSNQVTGSKLHRSNLDGSASEVLLTDPGANFRDVVVDPANDRVLVADYVGLIHRFDLAGVSAGAARAAPNVWGLALNSATNTIFFTDYAAGSIMSGDLAAVTWFPSPVVNGLGNPTHLDIDVAAGKLYWSEAATGAQKIQRANLNGTGLEDLGIPIAAYGGLAIGPLQTADVPGDGPDRAVTEFALGAAVPNPARGSMQVRYAVGQPSRVSLRVFDIQGREVATLFDGVRDAGRYTATWNGVGARGTAPSGLYFVRFTTPDWDRVVRLVLQR